MVDDSSCEAEYIAASEAAKEGVWMKEFMTDLGVVPSALDPMTLFCDNTGAIALAKEPRFHKEDETHKMKLQFHQRLHQGGGHKYLQSAHGCECWKSTD